MFDLIVCPVLGGFVGWFASVVMRSGTQQGIILNILIGVAGAVAGELLLKSLIDESLAVTAILASLLGAIILLGTVNLLWRIVVP